MNPRTPLPSVDVSLRNRAATKAVASRRAAALSDSGTVPSAFMDSQAGQHRHNYCRSAKVKAGGPIQAGHSARLICADVTTTRFMVAGRRKLRASTPLAPSCWGTPFASDTIGGIRVAGAGAYAARTTYSRLAVFSPDLSTGTAVQV